MNKLEELNPNLITLVKEREEWLERVRSESSHLFFDIFKTFLTILTIVIGIGTFIFLNLEPSLSSLFLLGAIFLVVFISSSVNLLTSLLVDTQSRKIISVQVKQFQKLRLLMENYSYLISLKSFPAYIGKNELVNSLTRKINAVARTAIGVGVPPMLLSIDSGLGVLWDLLALFVSVFSAGFWELVSINLFKMEPSLTRVGFLTIVIFVVFSIYQAHPGRVVRKQKEVLRLAGESDKGISDVLAEILGFIKTVESETKSETSKE